MTDDYAALCAAVEIFRQLARELPDGAHHALVLDFLDRELEVSAIGTYREHRPAEIQEREVTETCHHPYRAVFWNPLNQVVQCHRCGEVIAVRAKSHPEGA